MFSNSNSDSNSPMLHKITVSMFDRHTLQNVEFDENVLFYFTDWAVGLQRLD